MVRILRLPAASWQEDLKTIGGKRVPAFMSKVYFFRIKEKTDKTLNESGRKIAETFSDFFDLKDRVAIKVHFGERGSDTYLSPVLVKAIYKNLKEKVKRADLVDCSVLYKSERSFASSHKKLAKDHGFEFAPISILDGEKGNEEIKVKVSQKHFQEVKLGAGIKDFNALLVISHFKGHASTGFGGAIKNVGMGLASKAGKLAMHEAFEIVINPNTCKACGICQRECPARAIFIENEKAKIDYQKCLNCGQCISVCPFEAVEISWEGNSSKDLQERMVEYTLGAQKEKKTFFVNVLLNITSGCDCVRMVQTPIMPDIGILASFDIVAIDQASLDLAGKERFERIEVEPAIQIDYAQKLGLGEKDYELVEI